MGGVDDTPETRQDLEKLEECVVEEMKRNFGCRYLISTQTDHVL